MKVTGVTLTSSSVTEARATKVSVNPVDTPNVLSETTRASAKDQQMQNAVTAAEKAVKADLKAGPSVVQQQNSRTLYRQGLDRLVGGSETESGDFVPKIPPEEVLQSQEKMKALAEIRRLGVIFEEIT